MHIAMIGQKGIPATYGGVERHVHDLSVGLVQAGHDVTVYNRRWYSTDTTPIVDGINVITLPSIHTKHLDTMTHSLFSTLHAMYLGVDVIHYHGIGPSLLSWIPRLCTPYIRIVTTFHSIDRYHQKWGIFAKTILRFAEWTACAFAHETITVSKSLTQYCRNEYNKETAYIPNGTAIATTENQPQDDAVLRQYGLVKNQYLLMVSRLIPHKGAHILLEAFCALKKQYPLDNHIQQMKLVVVGGSVHTDDYVHQLYERAQTRSDIIFTGMQSGETKEALYRSAYALVHPSFNEGLPMTVLEAMSYELLPIVTSIPEHKELLSEPMLLCKENDVQSLTNTLYTCLHMDHETKQALIREHKARVISEYAWDRLILDIVSVYQTQKTATHDIMCHI